MLGQVGKLMDPGARADFAARFAAWWDGRDYVAPEPEEGGAEAPKSADTAIDTPTETSAPPAKSSAQAKEGGRGKGKSRRDLDDAPVQEPGGDTIRIRALQALWGEGRFSPGSSALDQLLLDEAFASDDKDNRLGFLGVDAALLQACGGRTSRQMAVADWRTGCADRIEAVISGLKVDRAEADRPKGLPTAGLSSLISVDAFAYADHKAGLVSRVHKALSPNGRWVILDIVRTTPRTPAEAFASAWAEPMLATPDELEGVLRTAGFNKLKTLEASDLVLAAAQGAFSQLAGGLDSAVKSGLEGRDGALFLQELAWEAASWRARIRALQGGALVARIWIAEKAEASEGEPTAAASAKVAATASAPARPAPPVHPDPPVEAPMDAASSEVPGPLDQSSIDSLFD